MERPSDRYEGTGTELAFFLAARRGVLVHEYIHHPGGGRHGEKAAPKKLFLSLQSNFEREGNVHTNPHTYVFRLFGLSSELGEAMTWDAQNFNSRKTTRG